MARPPDRIGLGGGDGALAVSMLASLLLLLLLPSSSSSSSRHPAGASACAIPVLPPPPSFRRPHSLASSTSSSSSSGRDRRQNRRREEDLLLLASSRSASSSSRSRRRKSGAAKKSEPPPASSSPFSSPSLVEDEGGEEETGPTLEEMRASLGPFGLLLASGVEVGVVTAGSYLSGGMLGYVLGGFVSVPSLFRPSDAIDPDLLPPKTALGEMGGRIKNWNSKAVGTCKTWAELSAAFSGFHALSRVVRGGKEDKWNGILGSAAAGAYFGRNGGPKAMVQGAATYGAFTYLLDKMFASPKAGGSRTTTNGRTIDDEFDFRDRPVAEEDEEARGF